MVGKLGRRYVDGPAFGPLALGVSALVGALACNSLDPPAPDGPQLVIPTDDRPAIQAEVAPTPLSGGTLHVMSSGASAVASDPDRDRLYVVDLSSSAVREVPLEAGARPGRIVEGADGVVHVALRGTGEVLTVDPARVTITSRVSVCRSLRGVAFDAASGQLHAACAEGRVVTLDAASGGVLRDVAVGADLRDVMVRGAEVWVTRFKSAELVRLDALGQLVASERMPPATVSFMESDASAAESDNLPPSEPQIRMVSMSATVAWRAVPSPDDGAVIAHQEAADDEIDLTKPTASGGSAYGGAGVGGCSGIVRTALSIVDRDGSVVARDVIAGTLLPVDVAVSPDGQWIAVASAGVVDPEAPRPFTVFPDERASGDVRGPLEMSGGVSILPASNLAKPSTEDPCAFPAIPMQITVPVVSVAFTPGGQLVAQSREPAALWVSQVGEFGEPKRIDLSTDSRLDTGHEIFHRDSGGGIACASCHPEGAEDGHVWRFSGVGQRRTQALHVGLGDTAPFHWEGDLPDVPALLDEVFVGRMGGVKESGQRTAALREWLFAIEPPPPMRATGDASVQRGSTLFHAADVGCSSCHAGRAFTDNETHAVGTLPDGEGLQVPSLIGVGYRAPFMHDGCAATLADRFDPACGGSLHGNVSGLSPADVDDVVAYLESL